MATSESSIPETMRKKVETYIFALQDEIVSAFEKIDPNAPPFKRDSWVRAHGSGGKGMSCVFSAPSPDPTSSPSAQEPNTVLEKAGVNISVVHGMLPPPAIKQMRADHSSIPYDGTSSLPFFAAGISLVVHPRNPNAPTVHANYRYFEITEPVTEGSVDPGKVVAWWFGGGSDLTPSYLYEEDAIHFHSTIKNACNQHGSELYPTFKKWCDEYFHIPHRGETRGIGGLFFDDLSSEKHTRLSDDVPRPKSAEDIFAFIQTLGNSFIPAYLPILERRMSTPTNHHQRRWQLLRRGRYVEFNLVYDRGTKFGLQTPSARIESILMSLPETARWEYMSDMGSDEASEEGKLLEVLKKPKEWV
ncbi:hypothetical protein SERLA73DRAFT_182560 [Serpula lacrymans var. lacrymans S7.3]|uniref:coproporphyrinogen oxidase n=1 Tax=Serpula lacrymans var. lacrymans (strain S7.3) TaxID=936435 RepID=F8Q0I1_SERL3|nr:hypothetical protein SERLA73DRAFT_182560 [Serpula lacrymans var. lacrymans S7.3]